MHYGVPQNRAASSDRLPYGVRLSYASGSRAQPGDCPRSDKRLPELANGAAVSWMPYRAPPGVEYARKMRGRQNNRLTISLHETPTTSSSGIPCSTRGQLGNIPARMMRNYTDRSAVTRNLPPPSLRRAFRCHRQLPKEYAYPSRAGSRAVGARSCPIQSFPDPTSSMAPSAFSSSRWEMPYRPCWRMPCSGPS